MKEPICSEYSENPARDFVRFYRQLFFEGEDLSVKHYQADPGRTTTVTQLIEKLLQYDKKGAFNSQ